MADRPKVFFDTSVLFVGLWSDSGGARQILKLAEARLVTLAVSPQVLSEIENNLRRKAPELLGKLAVLLDRVGLVLVGAAQGSYSESAVALTAHPGDGRVLADARESGAEFLVTLDRQQFLDNEELRTDLPLVQSELH
jgi:predicted nucleic acid-binding protein